MRIFIAIVRTSEAKFSESKIEDNFGVCIMWKATSNIVRLVKRTLRILYVVINFHAETFRIIKQKKLPLTNFIHHE